MLCKLNANKMSEDKNVKIDVIYDYNQKQ